MATISLDCDDADRFINPSAPEVCDGIDNDCDAAVDDNPIDGHSMYTDADDDGFGDGESQGTFCADEGPPDGYSDVSTDCDDADEDAFPGAIEVCDGKDNDCNGNIDTDAIDRTVGWPDSDDDGYGEAGGVPIEVCTLPSNYVDNEGEIYIYIYTY